ncbi:MAG: hypothetical protein GXY58_15770 [Planctomycetaceae bacterium]|nr:hypothetical protein [Planctomycetaceae bacterium]
MRERCFTPRRVRVAALVACTGLLAAVIALAGPLRGDDPPAAAPAAQPESAKPAKPAKPETPAAPAQDPDRELLEQWQKNIAKWKEIDPREEADNTFCYVCHANYDGEKLVTIHEPEGVGCETCHGRSDKHSQDEDSLVPPDVIFATANVAKFCTQCHAKRDLLDGDESHEKLFAGELEDDQTCTNCHDINHKLKVRTRRWDKETREVEWYDGVRMMQQPDEKPIVPSTDEKAPPK